jgi:hypothetical protein
MRNITSERKTRTTKATNGTKGWWFKDGRGGWHYTDVKPRGGFMVIPTTITIPRKVQVREVLTTKQYVAQQRG